MELPPAYKHWLMTLDSSEEGEGKKEGEREREGGGRRKERKEKLRAKMDDLCFVSVPHNGNKISFL